MKFNILKQRIHGDYNMDICDSKNLQPDYEGTDIVSRGCAGRFAIPHDYVQKVDPMLQTLLSKVLITQAESVYHTKRIHYVGYSELFDPTSPTTITPEYFIKITVRTTPEMRNALDKRNVPKAIVVSLNNIGKKLVTTAQEGIKKSPKRHKLYFYPGVGWVRSSIPHTYPANQSGRLRRSVAHKTSGYRMKFGASADYAKYLQQTDSPEKRSRWVKIAPRPLLTLSHNENKAQFGDIIQDDFERITQ